jgi:hypothetical protein
MCLPFADPFSPSDFYALVFSNTQSGEPPDCQKENPEISYFPETGF